MRCGPYVVPSGGLGTGEVVGGEGSWDVLWNVEGNAGGLAGRWVCGRGL